MFLVRDANHLSHHANITRIQYTPTLLSPSNIHSPTHPLAPSPQPWCACEYQDTQIYLKTSNWFAGILLEKYNLRMNTIRLQSVIVAIDIVVVDVGTLFKFLFRHSFMSNYGMSNEGKTYLLLTNGWHSLFVELVGLAGLFEWHCIIRGIAMVTNTQFIHTKFIHTKLISYFRRNQILFCWYGIITQIRN